MSDRTDTNTATDPTRADALAQALCLLDTFAGEGLIHVYGNGQELAADTTILQLVRVFGVEADPGWYRKLAADLVTSLPCKSGEGAGSMKPWRGGDSAPLDWDGGPVVMVDPSDLSGDAFVEVNVPPREMPWKRIVGWKVIVAYTPIPAATQTREAKLRLIVAQAYRDCGYDGDAASIELGERDDYLRELNARGAA